MTRVGLLGAGRIGALHGSTLAADPGVERVVVGDVDAERAQALAGRLGSEYGTIEEVMRSRPDAVVIAASTSAHAGLIRDAVDAGIPAFCEKPVALGYEETLEIVEKVESGGAVLQIGFQRRFDAGYVEAKRIVYSGALGTLYSLRLATHDPEPPHEGYIPTSGGIFRDLHIHDFDILRWLAGSEVEEVYAVGSVRGFEVFSRYGDVDTAAALIKMEDGVVAVLTGGRHDPLGYDVRAEVFGSGDSIAVGLDGRTPLRSVESGMPPPEKPYPNFQARFEDAYRAELRHFLRLARGEAENPCTARDALEALRIAMAADLSLAERRPVRLSEVG
ncbi:MAG TPA: Gfo/Idh/MocA family oxidoreductase [Rubrobacteraceae bacterium]|nr:Gfo/Idh/MocA family oxidoreductase [Rubrobacteraceae bacterium]